MLQIAPGGKGIAGDGKWEVVVGRITIVRVVAEEGGFTKSKYRLASHPAPEQNFKFSFYLPP